MPNTAVFMGGNLVHLADGLALLIHNLKIHFPPLVAIP